MRDINMKNDNLQDNLQANKGRTVRYVLLIIWTLQFIFCSSLMLIISGSNPEAKYDQWQEDTSISRNNGTLPQKLDNGFAYADTDNNGADDYSGEKSADYINKEEFTSPDMNVNTAELMRTAAPNNTVLPENMADNAYDDGSGMDLDIEGGAVTENENTGSDAVTVYPEPVIWGNRSRNEMSLTFDDGHDPEAIQRVLDAFRKANIKTTFFVIGVHLRDYPDLWRQAVQDGHQICNHTLNHKSLRYLSEEQIKAEILGWEDAVIDVLGEEYLKRFKSEFPYLRLPGGGGANDQNILRIIHDLGYIPVGWSDETYHSIIKNYDLSVQPIEPIADEILNRITTNSQNGSIVLLHFVDADTLKIDEMINNILQKGLTIQPVSQLLRD